MSFSALAFPLLLLFLFQGGPSCRGGGASTNAPARNADASGPAAGRNKPVGGNRAASDKAANDNAGDDRGAPARGDVPAGTWGGKHVRLEVTEAGAAAEFDCAHGRLDQPLRLDASGNFDARGTFVRERGGPARSDEEEPAGRPARYAGRVTGQTMTLKVTLADSGDEVGAFTLTRGSNGRLFKCL